MRSRNGMVQSSANGQLGVPQPTNGINEEEEGNIQGSKKRKMKPQQEKDGENVVCGTLENPQKNSGKSSQKMGLMDLSKEDLLHLLGVMEGEVQAREDVIHILESGQARPEVLEAHYGSAVPFKALQALHRDSLLSKSKASMDDVYQTPMAELDRLEEKHREAYRRMLEQLLLAEKSHRGTVHELDSEKRKHVEYMNKSDDFTDLLEQERERLKRLLEQEKAFQAKKDKEHSKRLEKVRQELVKLKSFALMLVEERQLHIEQIHQESQKVQDFSQKLQEKERGLAAAGGKAKEDEKKILKLEVELEQKATRFTRDHEEMTAKLAQQESQGRQLRLKLASLTRRIEELEESNQNLQRSEEELQELRDKISNGECSNSSLMAELETLRKRVLEMEGKDEEITKTESQCKELRKKLQNEENHSKELKLEVEKLQRRMVDLEKLEGAFNMSKAECVQLHASLDSEKGLTKDLTSELEMVKSRVKDLESSESRLEKVEMSLKDDLTKLKSFTVILVDERKNMAERIKQEEKKSDDLNTMFKTEQGKVMEVTEKLIEESKKLLKLKSEMEGKVTTLTKEKDKLKTKLASEEEKCRDLRSEVSLMKTRMERLEAAERENAKNKRELGRLSEEDSKVQELTKEIDRLRSRLQQLEVVEGDLMKTEDEYDLLEKKFRTEQEKANALSLQLEEMRSQIARNKAIEKGEAVSQEAELRQRCKLEEAKTRDLQADVQALKEKIHELMNKEDQLSQLQVDYSVLQQRFIEEENKKKTMSQEVLNLTKELEVAKRYSRALRPSMNGRRIVDIPLTSTGVQTDAVASEIIEEDTPAVFIRKSVLEENHIMSNLRQKGLKKPAILDRYPPATNELTMRKSWIPWMRKKETVTQNGPEKTTLVSGDTPRSPTELTVSQKQGQPLHIRVTPDHENSTATLEISSPRAEDFFSSTAIIPNLGLQKPRITIIPKPTTVPPKSTAGEGTAGPERAKSPVTITTISRAKSPERSSTSLSERPVSPVSIITVNTAPASSVTGSLEPKEMTMGRAVFRVTPEKQTVPTPRKYNSNANIITTTEDNKIHIHLGPQVRRSADSGSSPSIMVRPIAVTTESKETSTGTVLRSPRHSTTPGKTTPGKVTSSITITPITSAPSRPTQSVPGQDVQSSRTTPTRIPMSKGMKTGKAVMGALGISTATRLESRAESQSMKIELKKSAISSSTPLGGGKG
ncbi:filamin-A-interacting protein 1-like isoform X1 [Megalops cyprinoides]|uniref:filamin-A-interacting protein 1-like isoform X1 n=1 Tax=Megalops cyprinoides TaxID=118141 RepID=UPI001864EB08|nr:filamin-A-interacting protein 1-like isoform X1 [Megalops cyprinoides]